MLRVNDLPVCRWHSRKQSPSTATKSNELATFVLSRQKMSSFDVTLPRWRRGASCSRLQARHFHFPRSFSPQARQLGCSLHSGQRWCIVDVGFGADRIEALQPRWRWAALSSTTGGPLGTGPCPQPRAQPSEPLPRVAATARCFLPGTAARAPSRPSGQKLTPPPWRPPPQGGRPPSGGPAICRSAA